MFGESKLAEFLELYPVANGAEAVTSADELTGDITICEQTWLWLEYQRRNISLSVYGYKFTYTSPYVPIASHITEIPFVFGNLTPQFVIHTNVVPDEADRQLSQTMMSYWVNFAFHADPNGIGLPVWPKYSKAGMIQNLGKVVRWKRTRRRRVSVFLRVTVLTATFLYVGVMMSPELACV